MSGAIKFLVLLLELLGPVSLLILSLFRLFRLHINVLSANASERFIPSTRLATYLGIVISYLSGWGALLFILERVFGFPPINIDVVLLAREGHPGISVGMFLGGFVVFAYLYIRMQQPDAAISTHPARPGSGPGAEHRFSFLRRRRFWLAVASISCLAILGILFYPSAETDREDRSAVSAPSPAPPPPPPPDEAAWKEIQSKPTAESCRAFPEKYPQSPHLAEARACEENELRKADDAAWMVARDGGEPEDYAKYLSQRENGLHAAEARAEKSRILESRSWAALQADPSVMKCGAFATQFPQSAHLDDAQRCMRDHSDWAAAQHGGEPDDYERYLKSWPQGLHAAEARAAVNARSEEARRLEREASQAKCVETARTGLRAELDRISESISVVGARSKIRYFYRTSPNPRSMALCLNWTAATPFSEASGAGFSNAALANTPRPRPVDSDAMYRCTYSKTPRQQCTCQVVHRNGGALLDIPAEWRAPCD